jgi:hypothetical protein
VYDTSFLAARAYNVVQDYLRKYRNEYKITKDTPKEELSSIFAHARRFADEAVQRLRRDLNMADTAVDDEAVDTTTDSTKKAPAHPITHKSPPEAMNVLPPVTETPLEQVSTAPEQVSAVDIKSQPSDVVDGSPKENDAESIVPFSSAN